MNKYWTNIIMALAIALVLWIVIIVISILIPAETFVSNILRIMGGTFPEGMVQFFTFWLFTFGILEIKSLSRKVEDEKTAYDFRILPETEQYVLNAVDVNNIKLTVLEKERKEKSFLLTDVIKKACTKYRSNKSTSEALEIVTTLIRINMNNSESEQSMIRYVAWAIPSVGFIGTILGIAASLGSVEAEMTEREIELVTSSLNIAFDTTLLSLLLSIVLMFYFHITQEKVDQFHLNMEAYIIENLINRIYKS